ncbi:Lectin-domain containing receptor kinase A4.3 [Hordeum vulgare]|nr:Lectin-domain containing receptor kinase A4.3 [Hordeum vulgare]
MQVKRKSRRMKAYTMDEDKILFSDVPNAKHVRWVSILKRWKVIQQEWNKFCATYESIKARPMSGIGMQDMAFQALEAFKVQHDGKSFHLSHCWRIIKDEEKLKAQYAAFALHRGKEAMEEVGEGEKPRSWGKTNKKNEDKWDAASIALIATVKGMMTKKDSSEKKHRKDKEEQMNAFMEIQRRGLEMEAEKQDRMLEMEANKQAKILEIEAANAKTKTKEVDLNTVSPRKRSWFEKMQADMLKFDDEWSMAASANLFCMAASVLA